MDDHSRNLQGFAGAVSNAHCGPQNQDPYRTGHEIPELREKANQQGTCLLSLFKNGENMLKSMWKTIFKKGLVAAKRVVWCSVSVVSTPTPHTTKLTNNQ